MQTITKCLAFIALYFSVQLINAQDTIPAIKNKNDIELLEKLKETIINEEKEYLKDKVEAINLRIDNGEITNEDAEQLKKEVAKIHALNIENRVAIVDNRIALLKRNDYGISKTKPKDDEFTVSINGEEMFSVKSKEGIHQKYDKLTSSDFVLAFGLNNALLEGENLDNSPYKIGGSRFLELGWAWKTRVFKNTNFMRLKYGYSFQINGLKPDNNKYFVKEGDQIALEEFPENLKKSKLTITNLVFPIHFEFGPSKKIEKEDYFRYSTKNKFRIGIGGYGGFNLGARQKLKYELDGENIKDKQKRGFNTSNLVYGISSYLAFGSSALYLKYDLSPIFKDQLIDQNNISIGLRFDID